MRDEIDGYTTSKPALSVTSATAFSVDDMQRVLRRGAVT
jgi:hypothetical protein